MVRTVPYRVTVDYIAIPKKLLRLYQNVLIGIDHIFINSVIFFITVFYNNKFTIIEFVVSKNLKTVFKCLGSIIKLYTR